MTPGVEDLWLLPLGGCGEIGMNLNLYGHAGRWLAVDCGITFARAGDDAPHVQMADPAFIAQQRSTLAGLIITHAHEDHVGAVPHLWTQLGCPVYTTAFTAAILRHKLADVGLLERVPIIEVHSGDRLQLEGFDVEWLELTHSTPETQALVIRTAAGRVFHTADWKLDPDPVLGPGFDAARLQALAGESISAMVCDSTNALEPGRSASEGALYAGLLELARAAPGRVIVGCFGSNVARLHTLSRVARATGRYPALLGRSLRNYHSAARTAGIWDEDLPFVDPAHLGFLPREEVLAIATGSQGEPGAALDRLASGNHPDLDLVPGDLVIFSSRVIPGNEIALASLLRRLRRKGVQIVGADDSNRPIHASGHPAQDELRDMYRWIQPDIAIPVHGEPEHLEANAALAADLGIPRQLVGRNGDLFRIAPVPGLERGAASVGRLGLDNGRLRRLIEYQS